MRFLRYILSFFSTKKNDSNLFTSAFKEGAKAFSEEMEDAKKRN
jgi:hypothetical protein